MKIDHDDTVEDVSVSSDDDYESEDITVPLSNKKIMAMINEITKEENDNNISENDNDTITTTKITGKKKPVRKFGKKKIPNIQNLGSNKNNTELSKEKQKILRDAEEKTRSKEEKLRQFKTFVEREQTKKIIESIGVNIIKPLQSILLEHIKEQTAPSLTQTIIPMIADKIIQAIEDRREISAINRVKRKENALSLDRTGENARQRGNVSAINHRNKYIDSGNIGLSGRGHLVKASHGRMHSDQNDFTAQREDSLFEQQNNFSPYVGKYYTSPQIYRGLSYSKY